MIGGFKDSVSHVQVNGPEILTACVDGCVRIHDVRLGKLFEFPLDTPCTSVALSCDQKCICVSCLDSTIYLIDKMNGDILNEYVFSCF